MVNEEVTVPHGRVSVRLKDTENGEHEGVAVAVAVPLQLTTETLVPSNVIV